VFFTTTIYCQSLLVLHLLLHRYILLRCSSACCLVHQPPLQPPPPNTLTQCQIIQAVKKGTCLPSHDPYLRLLENKLGSASTPYKPQTVTMVFGSVLVPLSPAMALQQRTSVIPWDWLNLWTFQQGFIPMEYPPFWTWWRNTFPQRSLVLLQCSIWFIWSHACENQHLSGFSQRAASMRQVWHFIEAD